MEEEVGAVTAMERVRNGEVEVREKSPSVRIEGKLARPHLYPGLITWWPTASEDSVLLT